MGTRICQHLLETSVSQTLGCDPLVPVSVDVACCQKLFSKTYNTPKSDKNYVNASHLMWITLLFCKILTSDMSIYLNLCMHLYIGVCVGCEDRLVTQDRAGGQRPFPEVPGFAYFCFI